MRSNSEAQDALDVQRSQKQRGSSIERIADDYVGRPSSGRALVMVRLDEIDTRVASLEQAIEQAKAESEQALRQAKRHLCQTMNYAIADFAAALLPFKDSLEAALHTETSDLNAFRQGIELVLRQLNAAFEKNDLVEICPLPGEPFDPVKHRLSTKGDIGRRRLFVSNTEQKGYLMAGCLIRPAVVRLMARP